MKKKHWLAVPLGFALVALVALTLTSFEPKSPIGEPGTLGIVEACTSGEVWLGRIAHPGLPDRVIELRWHEQETTVGVNGEVRPLTLEQRASLPRAFAQLEVQPGEQAWLERARAANGSYAAGGACGGEAVVHEEFYHLALGATLEAAPLEDAPRAALIWLRGRGRRAASLFDRLDRLTR